jgi:Cof subfamily protein (haloacid dehalogenase superfamily)
MKYKIVFFDIDGTLTSETDGLIPHSTKVAIHALIKSGVKVVVATGRSLRMCSELVDLGIDTFITANGAYITHNNSILHKMNLNQNFIQEISEFAKEQKGALGFFTDDYSIEGIIDEHVNYALNDTLPVYNFSIFNESINKNDICGICLYADDKSLDKYINKFPHITFKRWHPFVVDVLENEVSKSTAIKKVLNFFDLSPLEAVAFGDGGNDVDMIEFVGLGIAMGNAKDILKEKADFVTSKSSDGGIFFALKHFGLI